MSRDAQLAITANVPWHDSRRNRITVILPDDLAQAVRREARRRDISVSKLTLEALRAHLRVASERTLAFAALGHSGTNSTAHEIDQLLEHEWRAVDCDR